MSSAGMAMLGRQAAALVLSRRTLRASERGRGPMKLAMPGVGVAVVHVKSYGAMDLDGVSSKAGMLTGLKVSELREMQRGPQPAILCFADYIVRELLWATVDHLATPGEFTCLDGRGGVGKIKTPIEHNNFGHDQFLWPVDWFPHRAPMPADLVIKMWDQRTHVSGRGKARDGRELQELAKQLEFRRALRLAQNQLELFSA